MPRFTNYSPAFSFSESLTCMNAYQMYRALLAQHLSYTMNISNNHKMRFFVASHGIIWLKGFTKQSEN